MWICKFYTNTGMMKRIVALIDDDPDDIYFLHEAILAVDPSAVCLPYLSSKEAIEGLYYFICYPKMSI